MEKRPIVFLNSGHGGNDPGAVAYGLVEKTINLTIAKACRDELVRHGVIVIMSKEKDENDKLVDVVNEANFSGCCLAVSFHENAGKGDGWEALLNLNNPDAVRLAKLAEKHVKAIGQNSRGLKDGMWLYFVKETDMTAVLFESAFLDHDKDNDIIDTVEEQKLFGVAYAKAILEYLDIAYKEQGTAEKPTSKPATSEFKPYLVRKNCDVLNIRSGPGTNYSIVGKIDKNNDYQYTIVEEKAGKGSDKGWGKLKSGAGWIALDWVKKV